jgi:hypothetical protein
VETWLKESNYEGWRRDSLRETWGKYKHLGHGKRNEFWTCKSFVKDEAYAEFKHARLINARSDVMKCILGPLMKSIEKEVYKLPAFVKHVPYGDRPKHILTQTEGHSKFIATDYSSFEALFTRELMIAVEVQLYEYMAKHLRHFEVYRKLFNHMLCGENVLERNGVKVKLPASRMSGEMSTSLGNGFTNLMCMLFIVEELGGSCSGVVEGDDGLFGVSGCSPTAQNFADLGMEIKLEEHDDVCSASFCGFIFDPEEKIVITEPLEEIASFGWLSSRYAKSRRNRLLSLLRCKSLSMAYQYRGCPILSALAHYGLRVTRSHDSRGFMRRDRTSNMWFRDTLSEALSDERRISRLEPGIKTRVLMEQQFGISVKMQIMIEQYFDSLECVTTFREFVPTLVPSLWHHAHDRYVGTNETHMNVEVRPFVPPDGMIIKNSAQRPYIQPNG